MMSCVELEDLTGGFLEFYEAARAQDAEGRWKLWQALYNFAALPPTSDRDCRARELLECAWPQYAHVLDRVAPNVAIVRARVNPLLAAVRDHLGYDGPITVRVLLFVGMLDGNAFAYRRGGECLIAIPVEGDSQQIPLLVAHELSHAVHGAKASISATWVRSLGELVIQEGIATRTTQAIFPGLAPDAYLDTSGELAPTAGADGLSWYLSCRRSRLTILRAVLENVARSDAETVQRFLIGPGPSGLPREAYYAGWEIVGALLDHSLPLNAIAAMSGESLPGLVTQGTRLAEQVR